MINFNSVSIKYIKEYYSLFNASFSINKNTLLLGDKTSGNNFVLRILAKIDTHYEGEILIDGINLKKIKDKNLNLAYVPSEIYLFKNKNLYKNLIYPLILRKVNKKLLNKMTASILKQYDIVNYLTGELNETEKHKFLDANDFIKKIKVKSFSYNAQKIIMLLRAIIWQPKYVLLENFFENLDAVSSKLAENIIKHASATIIATEENDNLTYLNFEKLTFESGSIKK